VENYGICIDMNLDKKGTNKDDTNSTLKIKLFNLINYGLSLSSYFLLEIYMITFLVLTLPIILIRIYLKNCIKLSIKIIPEVALYSFALLSVFSDVSENIGVIIVIYIVLGSLSLIGAVVLGVIAFIGINIFCAASSLFYLVEYIISQCVVWPVVDSRRIFFNINSFIIKYNNYVSNKPINYKNNTTSNSTSNPSNIMKTSNLLDNDIPMDKTIHNPINSNKSKAILIKLWILDCIFNKLLFFSFHDSFFGILNSIVRIWLYSLKVSMVLYGRWCRFQCIKDKCVGYDGERKFWKRKKSNIETIGFY